MEATSSVVLVLLFGIFLSVNLCVCEEPGEIRPGFVTRITQAGLNYANDVGLKLLMSEINNLRIPDINEKKGVISISLTNIKIEEFPRPSSRISAVAGSGLMWWGRNLSPKVTANFSFSIKLGFFTIRKSGTITAHGNRLSFKLAFFIGRYDNGRPFIRPTECVSRGGDLQLHFSGGWSSALNMATGMFKSAIKSAVSAQICVKVREQITTHGAHALSTMPVTERVDDLFDIDFGLVKYPSFTGWLQTFHKGVVYSRGNHVDPPFVAPKIPEYASLNQRMVYLFVTSYLFNSATYAAFTNNLLNRRITAKDLPPNAKSFLSTSCMLVCIGTVFPEVEEKYPDASVEIDVNASRSPHVTINRDNIIVSITADADFSVQYGGKKVPLFTLNTTASVTLHVIVEGNRVKFNVTNFQPQAFPKSSNLENPGTSFFYTTITRIMVRQFALPKLNELGEKGFVLPDMQDVKFVRPAIMTDISTPDMFVIGLDVEYTGTPP